MSRTSFFVSTADTVRLSYSADWMAVW